MISNQQEILRMQNSSFGMLPPPTKVGGLTVGPDWLKDAGSTERYRAMLHLAFNVSRSQKTLRDIANGNTPKIKVPEQQQIREHEKEIKDCSQAAAVTPELLKTFKTVDLFDELSVNEKLKMVKLSRSCSKKSLTRYSLIEEGKLIYFEKPDDLKPKKQLQLEGGKVSIERLANFKKLSAEEQKSQETAWTEPTSKFRVKICLKQRELKPIYCYSITYSKAVCIKMHTEKFLGTQIPPEVKSGLTMAANVFKMTAINTYFTGYFIKVYLKKRSEAKLYQSLHVISKQFVNIDAPQILMDLKDDDKQQFEVDINNKIIEENVLKMAAAPDLVSTLKVGQVHNEHDHKLRFFHTHLNLQHFSHKLASIFKNRRARRHPLNQKTIESLVSQNEFQVKIAQKTIYQVHQAIQEINPDNLPFPINNVDKVRIESFSVRGNQIAFCLNALKSEHFIDVAEISAIGLIKSEFKLYGRRVKNQVDRQIEEYIPSQAGYERFKYSRLETKDVFKLSLKKINIPKLVHKQQTLPFLSKKAKVLYTLRFDYGKFHCYSTYFEGSNPPSINLRENIEIDLRENIKTLKITLLSIQSKDRDSILNPYIEEREVSHVTLRVEEFIRSQSNPSHTIVLNGDVYKKSSGGNADTDVILSGIILVKTGVNGAYQTSEMEGKQLLVGGHCLYQQDIVCKVVSVQKNTCQLEVLASQPQAYKYKEKVLKDIPTTNVKMIEGYGVSVFDLSTSSVSKLMEGQHEWTLTLNCQEMNAAVAKIQEAIARNQIERISNQRKNGKQSSAATSSFITGEIQLSILTASNLLNPQGTLCDSFVQVTVKKSSETISQDLLAQFADKDSFILAQQSQHDIVKQTFKTEVVPQSNYPSWVSEHRPHGKIFNLGKFVKRQPMIIRIEVFNEKKSGLFSSSTTQESLGFVEVDTDDLMSLEDVGQELIYYLDNSDMWSSSVKVRVLFVPSEKTIERQIADSILLTFKNPQQFILYKALTMTSIYDSYGYKVPIASYQHTVANLQAWQHTDARRSGTIAQKAASFALVKASLDQGFQKYTSLAKQGAAAQNMFKPSVEQNIHYFQTHLKYLTVSAKNKALMDRQRKVWHKYIEDIVNSPDHNEQGLVDDDLRSLRSRLSNTTKVLSAAYKRRIREGPTTARGLVPQAQEQKQRFSAQFIGQWQKEESWKFIDIWDLVRHGVPDELRVELWKDFLTVQKHESDAKKYIQANQEFAYKSSISVYENLKEQTRNFESTFYQQLEQDIKNFKFPIGYKEDIETQRASIYQILQTYSFWASKFSQARNKVLVYSKGMIGILKRLLTMMSEEQAFWQLVGIVKSMHKVYSFDHEAQSVLDAKSTKYEAFNPWSHRYICFKKELVTLQAAIKIHYPEVFAHLKNLSIPIDWYFYDSLASFYSDSFSSDLVLRLWDIIILNLASNDPDNKKKALWYLIAVPLYMIRENHQTILTLNDPQAIKEILTKHCLTFDPSEFLESLIEIIKLVFVKKEGRLNEMLKTDAPHKLEAMRKDIAKEFDLEYGWYQESTAQLATFIFAKDFDIGLKKRSIDPIINQLNSGSLKITISVLSLRSIVPKNQSDQYRLILKFDSQKQQSDQFALTQKNPQSNLSDTSIPVSFQITLTGNLFNSSLSISLVVATSQAEIGNATILVSELIMSNLSQTKTLKLNSNEQDTSIKSGPYIDLKLQAVFPVSIVPKRALTLDGGSFSEKDLLQILQDEEMRQRFVDKSDEKPESYQHHEKIIGRAARQIVEHTWMKEKSQYSQEILVQALRDTCLSQQLLQFLPGEIGGKVSDAHNIISRFHDILKGVSLQNDYTINFIMVVMRILTFSERGTFSKLVDTFYDIFGPMNTLDAQRLISHMYTMSMYPMPINEITGLLSLSVTGNHSTVIQVTQQAMFDEKSSIFNRIFSPKNVFDVTQEFVETLNCLLRVTCLTYLNFEVEPLNDLNFWLSKGNNLKRTNQVVTVSMRDSQGVITDYKFMFNERDFFEAKGSFDSRLTLQNPCYISKKALLKAMESDFPLLSSVYAQDLFLKQQIEGFKNHHMEAHQQYEVKLQLGKVSFSFKFSTKLHQDEDYSIGGNSNYNKFINETTTGDKTTFEVQMSPVSFTHTFIEVKQRIQEMLKLISQTKDLNIAKVMSMSYQFKQKDQVIDSLDRVGKYLSQEVRTIELVKVEPQSTTNQYQSLGLFTHPSGHKEWLPCRILSVINNDQQVKLSFKHEKDQQTYLFPRDDVLLSPFDIKDYQTTGIQELLEKFDQDEVDIAKATVMHEHGMKSSRVSYAQPVEEDRLRVANSFLKEEQASSSGR